MDGCNIPQRRSELFRQKLVGKVTSAELDLIMEAYRASEEAHRGQSRDGGEPYDEHPRAVAEIIIDELHIYDSPTIISALLHDVVEDNHEWDIPRVKREFGEEVGNIVKLLTKSEEFSRSEEAKRAYLWSIANAEDWRVPIIKLADRLHNLRTCGACTLEKQRRYVEETQKDYLPLAEKVNPYLAKEIRKCCQEIAAEGTPNQYV